jgi:hypothetical protein
MFVPIKIWQPGHSGGSRHLGYGRSNCAVKLLWPYKRPTNRPLTKSWPSPLRCVGLDVNAEKFALYIGPSWEVPTISCCEITSAFLSKIRLSSILSDGLAYLYKFVGELSQSLSAIFFWRNFGDIYFQNLKFFLSKNRNKIVDKLWFNDTRKIKFLIFIWPRYKCQNDCFGNFDHFWCKNIEETMLL